MPSNKNQTRRTFLKASTTLAAGSLLGPYGPASAATANANVSKPSGLSQTTCLPEITGGSESSFPSADAPGSNDGGYNILFILTDQEHYMGPSWPIPLPGHERLRRTGTYFENHQIAADMCSASRAVIYTGLHMPHNGIFDNAGIPYMKSLDPKLPTVGKVLRKIGYYPAYKGKVHLNGAIASENKPDHIKSLFESMMDKDYGFYDYTGSGDYIEGALGGYQYDDMTAAQATQWLKAKGQPMTAKKQPWFLAVNFVNPHDVMWVNTDDPAGPVVQGKDAKLEIAFPPDNIQYKKSWDDIPLQQTWQQSLDGPDRIPAHRIYHEANAFLTGMIPNDEQRLRRRQNYYFNAIQDVDKKIDALLQQLDDLALTKNTIVIFTSDHGDLLGSHGGLSSKGTTTYKQQNHVPFLVVHPEIQGGQRCKEVTSHIDILPTIVALTQKDMTPAADMMKQMKGQDLSPLLKNPVDPSFTKKRGGVLFCYSQLMVHDPEFTKTLYTMIESGDVARTEQFKKIETFPVDWSLRVSIRSIVDERYKFSRYFSFKEFHTPNTLEQLRAKNDLELYDLQNDPQERINLAYNFEKNKALIWSMNVKLNTLIEREIGKDDGSFLPLSDWINWDGARKTMINV